MEEISSKPYPEVFGPATFVSVTEALWTIAVPALVVAGSFTRHPTLMLVGGGLAAAHWLLHVLVGPGACSLVAWCAVCAGIAHWVHSSPWIGLAWALAVLEALDVPVAMLGVLCPRTNTMPLTGHFFRCLYRTQFVRCLLRCGSDAVIWAASLAIGQPTSRLLRLPDACGSWLMLKYLETAGSRERELEPANSVTFARQFLGWLDDVGGSLAQQIRALVLCPFNI